MKCLILAGGFGTRLWSLTKEVAKPLLILGGKPVITHIVEKVPESIEIIVTTNRKYERGFLDWQKSLRRSVEVFVEEAVTEQEKLGALGSIDYVVKQKKIDEDLLIVAGDNFFTFELSEFINTYNGKDPLVAVYDIKDKDKAMNFGVAKVKGGKIISFREKPSHPTTSLVATACYVLPSRVLTLFSDCCASGKENLGDFVAYLVNKARENVYAYVFDEEWFDIGSADLLKEARRVVK